MYFWDMSIISKIMLTNNASLLVYCTIYINVSASFICSLYIIFYMSALTVLLKFMTALLDYLFMELCHLQVFLNYLKIPA